MYLDLQKENVQTLINKIGDEADIAKSKKMQNVLQKHNAVLEKQYDDLQKNGECPKCGIFAASAPEGEDDENAQVGVAAYSPTDESAGQLEPVNTEEEWKMLEEVFNSWMESEDEDEDLEDDVEIEA